MQVGHETPNIIRLSYRQEKDDPKYGSCLWADFYLDPERGSFMIMSDCGEYSYRWPETGWDFIRLMEGVDEDYLLRKMCEEKKVDVEGTLERLREALSDGGIPEKSVNRRIEDLKDTFEEYYLDDSPDLTGHLVTEWVNEYRLDLPDAYEYVKTGYDAQQERIMEIYVKHIRPLVREAAEGSCIRNTDRRTET